MYGLVQSGGFAAGCLFLAATFAIKEDQPVSMDLFRRKQNLIFWIVTIIIVPSFVLVWGYSGGPSDGSGSDPEIATINGQKITFAEFGKLRQRLQAAVGELPFYVMGTAENQAIPDLWTYVWASYLLTEAEKAGIASSDLQVGTYLRNIHLGLAQSYKDDPAGFDAAVNSYCMRHQISRSEFMRGVKEWTTIMNYVQADNNTLVADRETAYAKYAYDRAEFDFKRIRVDPTDTIREQAKTEVMERPAEELEADVRQFIASRTDDVKYREPARWKFDYILMPYNEETEVAVPTEQEITADYNANRNAQYAGKTLEEARADVVANLERKERQRQTLRNLSFDIDPALRTNGELPIDEIGKLTPLVKYGVKTGSTGPELHTAVELATSSAFSPLGPLVELLNVLDSIAPEMRATETENWKKGFLVTSNAFPTEKGYLRLRLTEYTPSAPVEVNDADGNIKPELFEEAVADLIFKRIVEITEEKAEGIVEEVRSLIAARQAGEEYSEETATLVEELPTETRSYRQLTNTTDFEFGKMGIGEVRGPLIVPDADGKQTGSWDALVLTERRIPSRETFDKEPDAVKTQYENEIIQNRAAVIQPNMNSQNNSFIMALQPSEAMTVDFWEKIMNQDIRINAEVLNPSGS